jgi:hypothetical protein
LPSHARNVRATVLFQLHLPFRAPVKFDVVVGVAIDLRFLCHKKPRFAAKLQKIPASRKKEEAGAEM